MKTVHLTKSIMARKYIVSIQTDTVPDQNALQSAIKSLGFRLVLDDEYAPLTFSGYLPCTLDGEDAGCTLKFDNSETATTTILLHSGGDPREDITVLIIAAALASTFAASVQDGKQQPVSAETLQKTARDQFDNLD